MPEDAFVDVDVDGAPVRMAIRLDNTGDLWSAEATLPPDVTPHARVSIRGFGVGRERALADAMEKIRDAVDRYRPDRRLSRS